MSKNQTFSKYRGNSQKLNSAHILTFGRLKRETNHDMLRLAEYRFIYEKIDNNRIPSKCRFWSSKFKTNLEASRHNMKQPRAIKTKWLCYFKQNVFHRQIKSRILVLTIIRGQINFSFVFCLWRRREMIFSCCLDIIITRFDSTKRP